MSSSVSLFDIADFIGTAAFAISGTIFGVRKNLDLLGVGVVAFLTALGGGTIRDILADRPPYSITHHEPIFIVLGSILFTVALRLDRRHEFERGPIFILSDAVGLVSFSITGALVGMSAQFNMAGVILLGFLTAVGGGMLRDSLLNEVPAVLTTDFYGSVAILISVGVYFMESQNYFPEYRLLGIFITGLALRLLAHYRGWRLPSIR